MSANETKKCVLVVDDDPICLASISKDLEAGGYAARTVTSAKEALSMLKEHPNEYSVVILDRVMPESNGLTLVDDIHREPSLGHLPLIMMTADADSLAQLDALNHGVDEFIYKPVEANLLLFTVQSVLTQNQQGVF